MPNGTPDVPGGSGIVGVVVEVAKDIFTDIFRGGQLPPAPAPAALPPPSFLAPPATVFPARGFKAQLREFEVRARAGTSPITGRAPIPTPAEGGPPLVTERAEDLPGPFVDPGLGILPFELRGIPEPTEEFFPFQPRPLPEPDVLEEREMAVDAPLLAGVGGLPAIFQRTTPIIGGVLGGLAQDIVSGFLRAPQEVGLGQVPALPGKVPCPTGVEKPSTRILRRIKASTGVSMKLSRAKSLIRELGLQSSAGCLGLTAQEVCQLLIAASPRRRRGISGSDIRIVKRTARRFESLKHDLSHIGGRAAPHHHRRRRHAHAHRHQ